VSILINEGLSCVCTACSYSTKYIAQLDCGNGDFQVISQCRFSIQTGCSQGPVDVSCSE
jgi:hypothetical protein